LVLTACQQKNTQNTAEQKKRTDSSSTLPKPTTTVKKDLGKMVSDLKASMVSYMHTAQPSYTMDDINNCEIIIKRYLTDIQSSKNRSDGMAIVKTAILELNRLNNKTQETLIETGEREQIAEIIILASSSKGYNTVDEDITEEWREW
jgi:hypothetical protein